ncbi:MAG: aldo/keto reductase [Planctomycetota bacterium]|jgi:aryl-alcohol dehydrogenase-like predicted oxidoreductase
MDYLLLGRSGLRVSELCLGTMTFGEEWGFGSSRDESRAVFEEFVEAGGNFLDTANKYTEGTSERLLGEFIAAERERFVVATKYTLSMVPTDPNACGNHRKNMFQAVEHSLRRLDTDYIDLLWVHAWDFFTSPEEILRGLDDLVRQGKVHYVGISDTPAWRVSQMNAIADLRGWSPFVAIQIQYSLLQRTVERELLPMAKALDLAVTPWGALGGGVLSGKYKDGLDAADTARQELVADSLTGRNLRIAGVVGEVAESMGTTSSRVALAWVRQQQARAQIIPILGARKLTQLQDNLASLDVELDDDALAKLEAGSAVELGFPHDFLAGGAQPYVYGETLERTRPHRWA